MSSWIEVKAYLPETPSDWSIWTIIFEEFDINGTVQTDAPPTLLGYLPSEEHERINSLAQRLEEAGAIRVTQTEIEDTNWAEAWKKFFKPKRIGSFLVRPTWEEVTPHPGEIEIVLDPSDSFGTGDHPTTEGCLRLLDQCNLQSKDVADIGCGSGILSVAAGQKGAGSIWCVDIEQNAVKATLDNLQRNGVAGQAFAGKGFDPLPEGQTFDFVLSNIISAAIINLTPEVAQRLRPDGIWIMSGIIEDNWPDVLVKCQSCGFKLVDIYRESEWIAAKMTR